MEITAENEAIGCESGYCACPARQPRPPLTRRRRADSPLAGGPTRTLVLKQPLVTLRGPKRSRVLSRHARPPNHRSPVTISLTTTRSLHIMV